MRSKRAALSYFVKNHTIVLQFNSSEQAPILLRMTDERTGSKTGEKRKNNAEISASEPNQPQVKKGRGRPKGSKNKSKQMTSHTSRGQRLTARLSEVEASDKASEEESKIADEQK